MFAHGLGLFLNNLFMSAEVRSGMISLLFLILIFFLVSNIHFTVKEENLLIYNNKSQRRLFQNNATLHDLTESRQICTGCQ